MFGVISSAESQASSFVRAIYWCLRDKKMCLAEATLDTANKQSCFGEKQFSTFAYAGRRRSGSTHKYAFTISENCTARWDAVGEKNGLSVRAFPIISVRIYLTLR